MNTDKLKFTGTCKISISVIFLAIALFYIGYATTKIRWIIPEGIAIPIKFSSTFKILKMEITDKFISDVISEVSAVRQTIPDILVTVDKTTTEIGEVRENIPEIIAEIREIPLVLPLMLQLGKFVAKSLKKKSEQIFKYLWIKMSI